MFRTFLFGTITTVGLLLTLWVLGLTAYGIYTFQAAPQLEDDLKTDAVIVLTGGKNRVNTALELLISGKGKKLLISGTHESVKLEDILQLEHMDAKWRCCIDLDPEPQDTIGNASGTVKWIRANDIHSFILVTSAYHMRRARNELEIALRNTAFNEGERDRFMIYEYPLPLDTNEMSQKDTLLFILKEYTKTVGSYVRRAFGQ
ncbi:MAG: YdcF family protein [Pseudobdellovibrionaceae bacterium]